MPVTGLTGLKGEHQVTLEFSPLASQAPIAASSGNDLFTAVKGLGLKLERYRIPCEMLVVDHLEPVPTAN
ncbi:MAG: TIGR03435 family protein [Bryobacterales bacterium]|nr:TIGR03435 family protein [Bryobacterales bacterium]MBV9399365.1 TIGR03435 family protein [Bryobacterales bacterium]